MTDFLAKRELMVERQLVARGIRDQAVLEAMREVPRERFLPERLAEIAMLPMTKGMAYANLPLDLKRRLRLDGASSHFQVSA